MRLKILMGLMVLLAAVVITLEYQYHYIYWSLAPKPVIPHLFFEAESDGEQDKATVDAPLKTPTAAPEATAVETQVESPAETPAKVPADAPADVPVESEKAGI